MMEKKVILLVFWNLGLGGIQRKIVDLSLLISQKKYDGYRLVILLRENPAFNLHSLVDSSNTSIHYVPAMHIRGINFIYSLLTLCRFVVRLRPVALVTFLDMASILCILSSRMLFWRKIPVILNEDTYSSQDIQSPVKRALVRLFYPYACCIIAPTQATKTDLAFSFGIEKDKIRVLPNWTLIQNGTQKSDKKFDLLFVGRLDPQKDIFFLLESIRRLKEHIPTVTLLIVGHGRDEISIRTFIKMHALEKTVVLKNTTVSVREWMDQAKIFVLTSRYEGMPIALLEAMAVGLPCIVRAIPGAEEYVQDGKTGLLAASPNEFACHVIRLLNDKLVREKIGNHAHNEVLRRFGKQAAEAFLDTIIAPCGNTIRFP